MIIWLPGSSLNTEPVFKAGEWRDSASFLETIVVKQECSRIVQHAAAIAASGLFLLMLSFLQGGKGHMGYKDGRTPELTHE